MNKSPAFQFYPDDFLGSGKVGTMTVEEIGVYTLLLCLDWNECGFVYDEEELARWCRCKQQQFVRAWRRVSRCFVERDGRFFNPRLDAEREKQRQWREKSSKGGKTSAEHRGKGGSTTAPPEAKGGSTVVQPEGNTPFPFPTPEESKSAPEKPERYPMAVSNALYDRWILRRGAVNYGTLRKAFDSLFPATGPLYSLEELLAAIDAYAESASASPPEFGDRWTPKKLADDARRWVRLGKMELVDEWGEPTERGRAAKVGAVA